MTKDIYKTWRLGNVVEEQSNLSFTERKLLEDNKVLMNKVKQQSRPAPNFSKDVIKLARERSGSR